VRARAAQQFGIRTGAAVDATLADYDAIVLAVKPQVLKEVAQALAPHLKSQLVISIAAGIRGADLARWLGGCTRVVRTMNTPALVGMGVTASRRCRASTRPVANWRRACSARSARSSGSTTKRSSTRSPRSRAAAGLRVLSSKRCGGRPPPRPERRAGPRSPIATFAGAAQLAAQSGEPASVLRERVTSKGGTTAAALASFDAQQVKAIVRGALCARARAGNGRRVRPRVSAAACAGFPVRRQTASAAFWASRLRRLPAQAGSGRFTPVQLPAAPATR
jgi:pyrroline-5-carboxylate reductase